jgi:hypothetical protein
MSRLEQNRKPKHIVPHSNEPVRPPVELSRHFFLCTTALNPP